MIYLVKIGQRFSYIPTKELAFECDLDAKDYLHENGFFLVSLLIQDYYQSQNKEWATIQPLELIEQTKPEPIKQAK